MDAVSAAAFALGIALFFARRPSPHDGPHPTPADPLKHTPELSASIDRIKAVAGKCGSRGAAERIESLARRFALAAYRAISKEPGARPRHKEAEGLAALRAELVNAVQAMYLVARREKHRAALDQVTDDLMAGTDAYVRMARAARDAAEQARAGGLSRNYEGLAGFPAPWNPAADPAYDLVASV